MTSLALRAEHRTLDANRAAAEAVIRRLLSDRPKVHVLEAGGGDSTHLGFIPNAEFTAVDLSPEQLARNAYAAHKIEADLESFTAYPRRYDVIAAHDVLEHLPNPDKALDILMAQLAPGGVMILAGPDPLSAKGLLTKFTPHAFHVWFYRTVARHPDAGKPGHVPFPAFLRWAVAPQALIARAKAAGLEVAYFGAAEPSWMLSRVEKTSRLLAMVYGLTMRVARALSGGAWRPDLSDLILVLRRPV